MEPFAAGCVVRLEVQRLSKTKINQTKPVTVPVQPVEPNAFCSAYKKTQTSPERLISSCSIYRFPFIYHGLSTFFAASLQFISIKNTTCTFSSPNVIS